MDGSSTYACSFSLDLWKESVNAIRWEGGETFHFSCLRIRSGWTDTGQTDRQTDMRGLDIHQDYAERNANGIDIFTTTPFRDIFLGFLS